MDSVSPSEDISPLASWGAWSYAKRDTKCAGVGGLPDLSADVTLALRARQCVSADGSSVEDEACGDEEAAEVVDHSPRTACWGEWVKEGRMEKLFISASTRKSK